jgi:hypothetical protein
VVGLVSVIGFEISGFGHQTGQHAEVEEWLKSILAHASSPPMATAVLLRLIPWFLLA